MEKESNRGLRLQARPDLRAALSHTPVYRTRELHRARKDRRSWFPAVEIPTTYFWLSRRGTLLQCVPPPQNPPGYEIIPGKRRDRLAPS